jgi:hypothetical protein
MFKFELSAKLKITESGEEGVCVGRAEYAHTGRNYLLRYCAGDGRAVEQWWGESALEPA